MIGFVKSMNKKRAKLIAPFLLFLMIDGYSLVVL